MGLDLGLFNDPSLADPNAEANAASGTQWLDPKIFTGDLAMTDDNGPALTEILTGTGDWGAILKGVLGSDAGKVAGGLGVMALLNKLFGSGGEGGFAGYKGSIPTYTASRTMNTIPTTVPNPLAGQTGQPATIPRRPGSGGITYFSPMVYTPVSTVTGGSGNDTVSGGAGNDTVSGGAGNDTASKVEDTSGFANGGIISLLNGHLGSYSDGGQLLRGPGDGVSDDIPATIADRQPARLADGEFVIPARIVSELGNGSTEAGARKLYAMMDRIKSARRKAKDIAADTKTDRYLPR